MTRRCSRGVCFYLHLALNDTLLSLMCWTRCRSSISVFFLGDFTILRTVRWFAHALTTVERQSGELTEANEAYRKELEGTPED